MDKKELPVLTLRSATMDDAATMFKWRNDESAWREFRNARPVEWDEHKEWVAKTLRGEIPGRILMVVEYDGQQIGVVRSEEHDDGSCEISYEVATHWRGKGLGKQMVLQFVKEQLAGRSLVAHVKKGNAASESIVRSLGLIPVKEIPLNNPDDPRPLIEWRSDDSRVPEAYT